MARAGGAYVVRDESAGEQPGSVDQLYPYTLKGLLEALEDARFRSFAGPPQVVMVRAESGMKTIRRYEGGREVPAEDPGLSSSARAGPGAAARLPGQAE